MKHSEKLKGYLAALSPQEKKQNDEHTIGVSEAVGAIAFYYEKIRNVIDYQDEHLIRQNAIKRIVSRRVSLQQSADTVASGLMKELVRSRYFPNNTVPLTVIGEVEKVIEGVLGISATLRANRLLSEKDQDWLLSTLACAIDEHLVPMRTEEALADLMFEQVEPTVQESFGGVDERMRSLQIFIAVYRVLLRPDVTRLRFFLLKKMFPAWVDFSAPSAEGRAAEYHEVRRKIDAMIAHPLNKKLMPAFRRFRVPFIVLHTLLRTKDASLLESPQQLEEEVRKVCENLYALQKKRLTTRTVRAFIYIFLTKMILGLAVELPYDMMTLHAVNALPLLVNVLFPPILLAFIALTVKFPGKDNTNSIVQAIREMMSKESPKEIFIPQRYGSPRKSVALTVLFTALYMVLFVGVFWFVAGVLRRLDFNIMSGVVFFVFFSLITFFGINLRRSIKDLIVLKVRPNLFSLFLDMFFLPIIQVGRWLSFNISRVNIFVFIFDVLIELPLQALIDITEEWFSFLREKKDEIE